MPKFTTHQMDVIMNIYDMFKDDPYIKSSHKKDIDHLKMVVEYMLNHEDDDGKDMQQLLQHGSPKIFIGSEGIQRFLNFDMPGFGILKQYFIDCEDDVRQIANDSRLNRNPMMKPYLNYSKMIMGRGLMEHPDRNSYASDVVYNSVSAIAGMFTRIPTEAELEHIRQTNPQVYETGLKIMKYIDAFTEFNDPKLLLQYDQTDKIDRQALQQERMRRLDNLEQAAHEFAGISRNQLMYFYDIIGCDVPDYTKNSVSADLYDNKKHNTEAGIRQLQDYRRLMQQGLTLEEARLLSDTYRIVKYIPSDFFRDDMKIEFLPDAIRTKWEAAAEAGRLAKEKFDHGFASEQEKHEVFKTIGTAFEELSKAVKGYVPNYEGMSQEEKEQTASAVNEFKGVVNNEIKNPESIFHRASNMKELVIAQEKAGNWVSRSELTPAVKMLKDAGSSFLGGKDSQEYKDYKEMTKALKSLTRMDKAKNQDSLFRLSVGENGRVAVQKGESYLNGILDNVEALQGQDPRRILATKLRVVGTLNMLHTLSPEKAEKIREKTDRLFGHRLSWEELKNSAKQSMDTKPNYHRYFELHTREHVQNLPDRKLPEYTAKAVSALFYTDEPNKSFSVSIPRKHAENLMQSVDFKAAMKAAGPEGIREALASGDPTRIVKLAAGGPERYAVSADTKAKFRTIAAGMNAEGRSEEYKALKNALSAPDLKDSKQIFDAVEALVKGKKSVKNDPERKEIVKTALDALALAAENGDAVAKARAQMLADRFNKVRGTHQGDQHYVDIRDYGHNIQGLQAPVQEGPDLEQNPIV